MSRFSEIALVVGVLVGIGTFVIATAVALVGLPDTDYKKTAITLVIPIVGAIGVGVGVEFFKFLIVRQKEDEQNRRNAVAEITRLVVSISMLTEERNGEVYATDMLAFKANIKELLSTVSSLGSVEVIESIAPLVD